MSPDPRDAVKELRLALLEVHRLLIEIERLAHEREFGRVERPAAMVELLMHSEQFAWLKPMSAFIVALDEVLELADLSHEDAAAARRDAEALMDSDALPFRDKYVAALQDPDVVVAHARWRRAVSSLPPG